MKGTNFKGYDFPNSWLNCLLVNVVLQCAVYVGALGLPTAPKATYLVILSFSIMVYNLASILLSRPESVKLKLFIIHLCGLTALPVYYIASTYSVYEMSLSAALTFCTISVAFVANTIFSIYDLKTKEMERMT